MEQFKLMCIITFLENRVSTQIGIIGEHKVTEDTNKAKPVKPCRVSANGGHGMSRKNFENFL